MTRRIFDRTTLAVLVALVSVAPVQSQIRVEGEVIDGENGVPIRGVIVQFPELGLATLTDSMGYFMFDAVPRGELLEAVGQRDGRGQPGGSKQNVFGRLLPR